MPAMPWLRLYTEFASDPVTQSLAFEDQRHFIILLCLKGNGTLDRPMKPSNRDRIIYRGLGLDPSSAEEAKRRLMEVELITDTWQPKAWNKRQFISDHSTERVRNIRKNKETRNGITTLLKRKCNAPRTDTEQIQNRADSEEESSLRLDGVFRPAWDEFVQHRKAIRKPLTAASAQKNANILAGLSESQQRASVDATIANNWTGLFPPRGNNGNQQGHSEPRSAVDRVRAAASKREADARAAGRDY